MRSWPTFAQAAPATMPRRWPAHAASIARCLELSSGSIGLANSVEGSVVGAGAVELAPAATCETLLAIAAAGLVGIADETMAAGEMLGDSVTDYRGTIDFLVNSGVHNAFLFGSAGLRNLFPRPTSGAALDLLQFAGVLGQVLYSLHRPGNPNNLGEVGQLFDSGFTTISQALGPLDPGVAIMLLNPGQPLTTSNSGGTATFYVQLTTQPASQVTLQFTSTNILAGTVTSSVIIDPTDWEQLFPVVVAGHNDGFVSGSVEYSIHVATSSADSAYDGLQLPDISITHLHNGAAA